MISIGREKSMLFRFPLLMRPERQNIRPRTNKPIKRYALLDDYTMNQLSSSSPFIFRFLYRLALWSAIVFSSMCIGSYVHETWVMAHPCHVVKGGEVIEVVPENEREKVQGADRRRIICEVNGEIKKVEYGWKGKTAK